MLEEMLDLFKHVDFNQHFIKEEKNREHFFASSTENTCWIRLKWFTV